MERNTNKHPSVYLSKWTRKRASDLLEKQPSGRQSVAGLSVATLTGSSTGGLGGHGGRTPGSGKR